MAVQESELNKYHNSTYLYRTSIGLKLINSMMTTDDNWLNIGQELYFKIPERSTWNKAAQKIRKIFTKMDKKCVEILIGAGLHGLSINQCCITLGKHVSVFKAEFYDMFGQTARISSNLVQEFSVFGLTRQGLNMDFIQQD